jgi:hypothetical protein
MGFVTAILDLYRLVPSFILWVIPTLVAGYVAFLWSGYALGKWVHQAEIAGLRSANDAAKAQNEALKAQNDVGKERALVMEQRLMLAREQQDISTKEATALKEQLEKLNAQIRSQASGFELQASANVIEGNLNRLMGANTAASEILGHISTGFDEKGQLKWRPIRGDEKYLLDPLTAPESKDTWVIKKDDD